MSSLLLGAGGASGALDRSIVAGRDDRWEGFRQDNVESRPGRWGTLDLSLQDNEYAPTPATDLLLHFNSLPVREECGHYRPTASALHLSERTAALGEGAAAFSGAAGLRLEPLPGSLLEPASWWGDFSIEFWLYPALLSDGEELLSWVGARWQGGQSVPQGLSCTVSGRRLLWSFENLFTPPGGGEGTLSLQGLTPLIPRVWHHHLLRFDSSRGLLEYRVDGRPEAVLHATDNGRETGTPLLPQTGDAFSGALELGGAFVGLMDELRLSRQLVTEPCLTRYSGRTGVAKSPAFDLGYTGTRLKRIDAVYDDPADSAVYFFYRLSDHWDLEGSGVPWQPLQAGEELADARGRYLQVMVEIFPDGRRSESPRVSEVRVVYEQDLPPPPPSGFVGIPGDGQVRLSWKKVNEADVRGYLVYYGEQPGNYHGTGSDLGPSPLDVGDVSEVRVTGLGNRKLYYFAVVAYDATQPPHRSDFSREISARPAELQAGGP